METSHLPDALKEVLAERTEIKADLDRLNHRDAALARVESSLREILVDQANQLSLSEPAENSTPASNGNYPKTTDLVLTVLEQVSPKGLSARGIVTKADEVGLLDPRLKQPYGSILEAAKRLAEKQAIRRRKKRNIIFFYFRHPAEGGDA